MLRPFQHQRKKRCWTLFNSPCSWKKRKANCNHPQLYGTWYLFVRKTRTLSTNESKNNDKKMKWLIEPIGILVLHDVLLEEKWEAHKMRFSSIRLQSQKSVY